MGRRECTHNVVLTTTKASEKSCNHAERMKCKRGRTWALVHEA